VASGQEGLLASESADELEEPDQRLAFVTPGVPREAAAGAPFAGSRSPAYCFSTTTRPSLVETRYLLPSLQVAT
jgi:hypothetical protein